MGKNETKKDNSFEKIITELHPRFLGIVKQVYPLAVLGSLSIAVAAFTAETYPEAQVYAITAASLFLVAFTSSFLFMIIHIDLLAVFSYISTAMATLFLFLVVVEFGKTVTMVSRAVYINPAVFMILLFSYLFLRFSKVMKKTKSRGILLFGVLSISTGAFFIVTSLVITVIYLLDVRLLSFFPPLFAILAMVSLFVSLISAIIFALLIHQERKKSEKVSEKHVENEKQIQV